MTYPIALGVRARKVDFAIKDLTLELHVGGRPCWINVRDSEVQRGTVERNGVLVPGPPPMLGVARELDVGGGRGPEICPPNLKVNCRSESRPRIDQYHCQCTSRLSVTLTQLCITLYYIF